MKKLSICLCSVVLFCFFNLISLRAEEPVQQTTDQQEKTTILEAAAAYIQYLKLQNSLQMGNRQFTLLSNIMKTKHDEERSAIDNAK